MAFDTGNFLVIGGGNPYRPGDFFIHERENVDGKPGKIVTMADGRGDLKEVAQSYIEKGFDPSKIIINGQPASDLFETEAKDESVDKKDKKLSLGDRMKLGLLLLANGFRGTNSTDQIAQQQIFQDNLRFQDMINMQMQQQFIDQVNLQNTLQMHHGM